MDITRLMQMRDCIDSLGAPLGVAEQVDQMEVSVAYRDIKLREQYQIIGGPRASSDVTIRVQANESLFDKLGQCRAFEFWTRVRCDNPYLTWRMMSPSGVRQTVGHTREMVEGWKHVLFSRAPADVPPVLIFRHTDRSFLTMFRPRPQAPVRDPAAYRYKRGN